MKRISQFIYFMFNFKISFSFYFYFFFSPQECESSLKHKSELLAKLESQKETMGNVIAQLEKKYVFILIVIFILFYKLGMPKCS